MKPEPFCITDIGSFLDLAQKEQWIAQRWELEFLIEAFPAGCLVARDGAGQGIGFITSLPHNKSGWIGNLIVADGHRGQGIGETLFRAALKSLVHAGVATVWLTASNSGKSLYEKHGFKRIDTINRWKWVRRASAPAATHDTAVSSAERVLSLDAAAWGDYRMNLVAAVMGRGTSLYADDGFVTLQPCGDCYQIGPFAARNDRTAIHLLSSAIDMAPPRAEIFLDTPESNRSASFLLYRKGLRICGVNELMYMGEQPAYCPELLYGLATMGSCG